MTELTGNEILQSKPFEQNRAMTVEDFVYELMAIYQKHVYSEGFRNIKDEKKFKEEAYEFVAKVFNP